MTERSCSPFVAISMLLMFKQRRLSLTEEQFDHYFDCVLQCLEDVNNEKYRLDSGQEGK